MASNKRKLDQTLKRTAKVTYDRQLAELQSKAQAGKMSPEALMEAKAKLEPLAKMADKKNSKSRKKKGWF